MIEIHEGIVLTPANWELPGTLTLETLAVFGEFMADQIEASGQIGAMDEPDESATGIEEKRIFEDKLPTLAGKLIFPPVGWIDHQSHLLGPIANATEGRLTLIARWFWSIGRSSEIIAEHYSLGCRDWSQDHCDSHSCSALHNCSCLRSTSDH